MVTHKETEKYFHLNCEIINLFGLLIIVCANIKEGPVKCIWVVLTKLQNSCPFNLKKK